MQLDDFKLLEVCTTHISFVHRDTQPGQGKIVVDYGEINFEAGALLVGDEDQATVRVEASPKITGYRDGSSDHDFQLKITMRLLFVYPKSKNLTQAYLQDNNWYFGSLIRTHFKFYADDILSKTTLKNIQLAYN